MSKHTTVSIDPKHHEMLKRVSVGQNRTIAATLRLLIQQAYAEAGN